MVLSQPSCSKVLGKSAMAEANQIESQTTSDSTSGHTWDSILRLPLTPKTRAGLSEQSWGAVVWGLTRSCVESAPTALSRASDEDCRSLCQRSMIISSSGRSSSGRCSKLRLRCSNMALMVSYDRSPSALEQTCRSQATVIHPARREAWCASSLRTADAALNGL